MQTVKELRNSTSALLMARWLLVGTLLVPAAARAAMPDAAYLDGKDSKVAVILAHGQGADPTSEVVDPLRKAIHREFGFHTLSLQMPVIPGKRSPELFQEYASTFPEADRRIHAAIDFLRQDKNVERIYLMGYSMGGRMTTAFLAAHPDGGIVGFIGVGLWAGGEAPLNTNLNLRKVNVPVIDIYAENDRDARFAENRRAFVSPRFQQVPVPGAKHDYRGHEDVVVKAVLDWLRQQEAAAPGR